MPGPVIKITLRRTSDGNMPSVPPPLGVMLAMCLAVVWLFLTIGYGLYFRPEPASAIGFAVFGGLCPILVIYGVITNRIWSRHLLVLGLIGFFVIVEREAIFVAAWAGYVYWGVIVLAAGYLYLAPASRKYFALIAGRHVPAELENVRLEPPGWLFRWISRVPAVAEIALTLLALLMIGWVIYGLMGPIFIGL